MVSTLDAASSQSLQPVLPLLEQALQAMAASDASAFDDALQALVDSAAGQAAFFKPRFKEWVEMMLTFATARGQIPDGSRSLAFEFVSTLAETKGKVLQKAVPGLAQKVLATAFVFLEESEEDAGWAEVDEDEGEDEDEGLHKAGEAKVDFFVKKLGFKETKQVLGDLLKQYGTGQTWQQRLGAAMAVRAAVEYVDDAAALDGMTALMLQLAQDQHPRVRYAALLGLGQTCHDQDPEFHARWHERLVPPLARACADPVDRVASMGAGALEAAISDLDEDVLAEYKQQVLEALVGRLRSSSHKGVLVAVMECLGALAAGLEGNFGEYYDDLVRFLLAFVRNSDASNPSMGKLRGKAFECITLLGYSVGKERFAPAARETMSAMLTLQTVADDVQTDCVRDAMERTCKILGPDFAPYLPSLLPGILASMRLETAVSAATGEEDANPEEDAFTFDTEAGLVKVRSGQLQEILAVVSLLETFIRETGAAYFEYVRPTAEALDRILGCTDPVLNLASSIRDRVFPCWAELVVVASKALATKGQEAQTVAMELVQRFVDKVAGDLGRAEDPDDIAAMASGIAAVVRNAGEGCLQPAQVQAACDLATSEIMKSFQREKAIKDANGVPLGSNVADEDESDDDSVVGDILGKGEEEEEHDCRKGLCEIYGACMKANAEVFVSHSWSTLEPLLREWLGAQSGPTAALLGLRVAGDLCEHLGERASAVWPVFMDAVIAAVTSDDPDARAAAASAIALAAPAAAFGAQYGARAFAALGSAAQKFKARKTDEEAQKASDAAIAALVRLCLAHPAQCPDLDACWKLTLEKLPLKADSDECRRLNWRLLQETQKQGGGNLGSPARIGRVLGYLCEVYGHSEICDEDLQQEIASAFQQVSQSQQLEALLSTFSPKQRKKAERVLQDGRAGSA
eukprot:TRINITY_DN8612_c0_g1_i2.p1 TRINITY_DN8612_c0_g1~~TRINITY_DN8612_c0_g1_i2.p1  ORF type:complete len:916 (-),score=300.39 TRINITY_DN8612_c0_g1_i2:26-2773(-)